MKALLKTAPGHGHVAVREIPVPEPRAGELLIRVKYWKRLNYRSPTSMVEPSVCSTRLNSRWRGPR